MSGQKNYSTEAQSCILQTAKRMQTCFTAADMLEQLSYYGHNHSSSTVYRILEKLTKSGKLHKAPSKNGTTRYYYSEKCDKSSHFTLICKHCGQVFHIDCHLLGEFYGHIYAMHGFKIINKTPNFDGICLDCRNKGLLS